MGILSSAARSLFGGSKSKQRSTSKLDPDIKKAFLGNYDTAKTVADNLGTRQFAGFSPDTRAGFDAVRSAVGAGSDAVGSAIERAGRDVTPSSVTAGSFLTGDVGKYMNPYTDQVINRTLGDINRSREMALQGVGDQAISAHAFGGNRQGVAEALTNEAYGRQAADTAAKLRSQGFDTATGLQQSDLDRALAAAQGNQSAGLRGGELNLKGAALTGELGAQQQDMGLTGAQSLLTVGGAQQDLEQQRLDAERELELERQRLRNEALGINPAGGSGSVSTSRSKGTSSKGIFEPSKLFPQ